MYDNMFDSIVITRGKWNNNDRKYEYDKITLKGGALSEAIENDFIQYMDSIDYDEYFYISEDDIKSFKLSDNNNTGADSIVDFMKEICRDIELKEFSALCKRYCNENISYRTVILYAFYELYNLSIIDAIKEEIDDYRGAGRVIIAIESSKAYNIWYEYFSELECEYSRKERKLYDEYPALFLERFHDSKYPEYFNYDTIDFEFGAGKSRREYTVVFNH